MSLSIEPVSFPISPKLAAVGVQMGLLALSKRFGEDLKRFVEVEQIGDNPCFQDIVSKYPGMDSASQSIAKILCDNQVDALDASYVSLSDQGIHGIRDALQKNTKLRSFSIIVDCLQTPTDQDCLTTFARDMVTALKVNRGLETLNLQMVFPYKVLATQVLFSNLPCLNIHSLAFTSPIAPTAAATVFPQIFSQKFPLSNFSWDMCLEPVDDTIGSIVAPLSNGIKNNTCLKTLDLSTNAFNATTITTLFEGIAGSKIQRFFLPQFVDDTGNRTSYAFSTEQIAAILEAIRSNPCFLECVPTDDPLPVDLAAAINSITKSRTPCLPDPECRISDNCPVSPVPRIQTFWDGILVGGVLGAVCTVATALGIYGACNYRSQAGEGQPLIFPQEVSVQ